MRKLLFMLLVTLSAGCQPSKVGRQYLHEALSRPEVGQVLLVQHTDSSYADAFFYVREGDGWKQVRSGKAFIGRNGVGKQREGDKKTPLGEMGVTAAFGILPNPGTSLPYIDIVPGIFACDCPCEFYNTIIDTALVHHRCTGEDMARYVPSYNYGMATTYNSAKVYPLGSNIFIHCKGRKDHTSGCVSLDEDFMKEVLQLSDSLFRLFVYE